MTCAITSLSLHHFRNYTQAQLEVDMRPVILTGHNGAGKTNILEAISLLTPGRGLRRAKLGEMDYGYSSPRKGKGGVWAVSALLYGMQGEIRIGTGRDPEMGETEKRLIRIDGKSFKSQAELGRHMAVLWLTPQMEQLFQEGLSAGRKFLDRLVYSFDGDHASRVNEYEFAMRERNRLLQMGRADPHWLDALEQTMAETGAAIAGARLHTAEHINHAIAHSPLSFPKAHITIHGVMEDALQIGEAAVAAEEAFRKTLAATRPVDAAAGRTLSGPHRSEMRVTHTGKQMPAESCSTGEQKALLLSIVLAQARSGARWHGVVPVLLLDEVVTHLDAARRAELFEEICAIGAQVWMTGTDAALFEGMHSRAQFFAVREGVVS